VGPGAQYGTTFQGVSNTLCAEQLNETSLQLDGCSTQRPGKPPTSQYAGTIFPGAHNTLVALDRQFAGEHSYGHDRTNTRGGPENIFPRTP
jgi:hypothetical protein